MEGCHLHAQAMMSTALLHAASLLVPWLFMSRLMANQDFFLILAFVSLGEVETLMFLTVAALAKGTSTCPERVKRAITLPS